MASYSAEERPNDQQKTSDEAQQPESLNFDPGELAPHWYSQHPNANLSEQAESEIKRLCDLASKRDVAARRWEVEGAWENRLFEKGYQRLSPRAGGGWSVPPGYGTDYKSGKRGKGNQFCGNETNIYSTYLDILSAALTRDVPEVRFEPQDPMNDADITAAESANKYKRVFARNNNLIGMHRQLVYYLACDGRSVIVADYILDAQRFGRETPEQKGATPETETELSNPIGYVLRHGQTVLNDMDVARGRMDAPIDANGQESAKKAGEYLKDKGVANLYTSPVQRAEDSANVVSGETGLVPETDDRFASLDIGDYAGQPKDQVRQQLSDNFANPQEPIPGGESPADFDARVQDGIFEKIRNAGQAGKFAVMAHDSVIGSMNRLFTGNQDESSDFVPPGGIAAIYAAPGGGYSMRPVYPPMPSPESAPNQIGDPRGMEVVEAFGKLEAKVIPINSQCLRDCVAVQVSREYDLSYAKAKFPDIADSIKPGSSGSGENELDRIARINACLSLPASYVTGDSMVRDCTITRTWLRPEFFMECETAEIKAELFEKMPDGALAVFAGEKFAFARNECMDDHLTLVQAFPGSGMNRRSLMSKVLSIQKRVNNWIDLLNAFFIKTVPMRLYDSVAFAPEIIQQAVSPGQSAFFQSQPGKSGSDLVVMEPSPTHQPTLPDFIKFFLTDLPQLLSGALPSLFGAESNTDTATGQMIQRDQALGRLATPWNAIQEATCSYHRQAVQLAARCRKKSIRAAISSSNHDIISIELSDLKGNVLSYPEEDANFPESWNQRQARYQQLLLDAPTNPLVMKLLALPKNLKAAKDAIGMAEFEIPEADAYDKQLGEMDVLLATGPNPNPQKVQLQEQLKAQQDEQVKEARLGIAANPQNGQFLQAMQQQIQQLPDFISTVPIDKETDNHDAEAAC